MNASDDTALVVGARLTAPDFDAVFKANYATVTRAIERVLADHARAEDIAIEAFWKLWQRPGALDELRRRTRRTRYESTIRNISGVRRQQTGRYQLFLTQPFADTAQIRAC